MSRLPIVNQEPAPSAQLPTVQALRALWQAVSDKPLWAPPNIWRYLRLRWRMRLQLLDAERVKLLAPDGKVNDCSSCTDMCCIGARSTVLLRLVDIATLKDLGKTSLIGHCKPRFTPFELAERPALRRQVQSASWQRFPVLKQNSFGACNALTIAGKCSLYPHWPLACSRFPYALHLDDMEVFYSRRCQSFWIHPSSKAPASRMKLAAVAAYNERIKDMVLLEYAPKQLESLGLLQFLSSPS